MTPVISCYSLDRSVPLLFALNIFISQMRLFFILPIFVFPVTCIDLDAEYSAFSGLVATLPVGQPEVDIRLSLSFIGDLFSYLYDARTDCPAFVGDCYNPVASETYFHIGNCPQAGLVPGWRRCAEGTDLIVIDEITGPRAFRFRLVRGGDVTGPVMREVAGRLSLHRKSPLMREKILRIESKMFTNPGVRITPYDGDGLLDGIEVSDEATWVFRATIPGIGSEISIEFDPSIQRMIIPISTVAKFDWLKLNPLSRRITFDCSRHPYFGLRLGNGQTIIIGHSRVGIRNKNICELRAMAADIDRIVIGRQLLESVDAVILDNVDNRIAFETKASPSHSEEYVNPMPLIPIFEPDMISVINNEEENMLYLDFTKSRSPFHGLFLWVAQPAEFSMESVTEQSISLIHTDTNPSHESDIVFSREIQGEWELEGVPGLLNNELLRIPLRPVAAGEVEIRSNKFGAVVMAFKAVVMEHEEDGSLQAIGMDELAIGGPIELSEPRGQCPVCLEEMQAGESVQPLPCLHLFHTECIRPWLEAMQLQCPLCRATVPLLEH